MDLTNLNRDRKNRIFKITHPTVKQRVEKLRKSIIDELTFTEINDGVQLNIEVTWITQETGTGVITYPEISVTGVSKY